MGDSGGLPHTDTRHLTQVDDGPKDQSSKNIIKYKNNVWRWQQHSQYAPSSIQSQSINTGASHVKAKDSYFDFLTFWSHGRVNKDQIDPLYRNHQ